MIQTKNADQLRKAELAQIHIAKVQLALADDAYRAILVQVTGKTSSKDLTWQGRKALLDHFKKIGFKVKAKASGRPAPIVAKDRQALIGKIEAQLAEAGKPWIYADAMAKRICKIDRIDWCEPEYLTKIIAALSYNAKRHGRSEG
ncbi:gp16 family protein [Undibacterium sp. SXout11W]|uniref:gp16 family protein n=1 Tax=Undibacterium sp. SXout11W TaxID=3413050 RepID=UPI003BEF8E2B